MHPCQILAHNPEGEELRAGEDGDHRREEREAGHAASPEHVASDDVDQHAKPEDREGEPDQARELQRQHAEAGHHVEGVGEQRAKRVVGRADGAGIVAHGDRDEARGAPRQQHVDGGEQRLVLRERVPDLGAKRAERAHVARGVDAHRAFHRELGRVRGDGAPERLPLLLGRAVDDVVAFRQLLEELRDLFRRVLQIVVERDDHVMARATDPGEQRVVLAVIAHQVDAAHPRVLSGQPADDVPAPVAAAVVDEDDLGARGLRAQHRLQPSHQGFERAFAVVDRNHH